MKFIPTTSFIFKNNLYKLITTFNFNGENHEKTNIFNNNQ